MSRGPGRWQAALLARAKRMRIGNIEHGEGWFYADELLPANPTASDRENRS